MPNNYSRPNGDEIEELAEYRPLSFAAIAALLFLLPGCLGVFHAAFLIFPVVAIALALLALKQSAASRSLVSGRRAALAALFLSLFLISFTIALHSFNARREYQFAAACVEDWLRLLRGDNPHEAYLLTLAYNQRPTRVDEDVPAEIRNNSAVLVLESQGDFLKQPEISALAHPASQVKLTGLGSRQVNGKRVFYKLVYDLHSPHSRPTDYFAIIEAQKIPNNEGIFYWQIGTSELVVKQAGAAVR